MDISSSHPSRVIALRVKDVGQLFQRLDPFPFRERDLDAAVEEYIVGWAGELPPRGGISIRVHLPTSQIPAAEAANVGDAIRAYFAGRREVLGWELRDLFRRGRASLLIGLLALALCLVLARWIADQFAAGPISSFVREGLSILGWVANWRPIEIFLYDWWPLARRRKLYGRLSQAQVILAPETTDRPTPPGATV